MANAQDLSAPLATPVKRTSAPANHLSATVTSDPASLRETWQRLEADPATTFHQSRAWVEAWSQGTGNDLFLVTLEQNGTAFAILPLEIRKAGGLKVARFAGTAYSNENTGLIDTQRINRAEPLSTTELTRALSQAGLAADIVLFDKMTPETAGRAPFTALPRVFHQNPSFQLPLFEDFNQVLAQINGKRRRKKFRVSERRLEALGGYRHLTGDTDAGPCSCWKSSLRRRPCGLQPRDCRTCLPTPAFVTSCAGWQQHAMRKGHPPSNSTASNWPVETTKAKSSRSPD